MARRHSPEVYRNRRIAVAVAAAAGLLMVPKAVEMASRTHEALTQPELPELTTDYIVQPGDTPDNIASLSGVQGSDNRDEFNDLILDQARAQGYEELQQGMRIRVPEQYAQALQEQQSHNP